MKEIPEAISTDASNDTLVSLSFYVGWKKKKERKLTTCLYYMYIVTTCITFNTTVIHKDETNEKKKA